MEHPFIAGEKIYLRGVLATDLNDNYEQWFNDAEVCRFNSHHVYPNSREKMLAYYNSAIKSDSNLVLAIVDKKSDKHIGNVALAEIHPIDRSAEFSIIIGDKEFWSGGYGREACRLIVEHGFKTMNLNRIYCGTSEDNVGMQKVADKIGFKKEGVLRKAMYKNGAYKDIFFYGLLKDEFVG